MKARKQGEIALKAAEQLRVKAQDTAQQLKDSSEQRLVKQLAAQRCVEAGPGSAAGPALQNRRSDSTDSLSEAVWMQLAATLDEDNACAGSSSRAGAGPRGRT